MALTVAGPLGCKQGWKEGRREGKVRFTALIGKYALTVCAIRSL